MPRRLGRRWQAVAFAAECRCCSASAREVAAMVARGEKITFANAAGELLAARLDRPAGAPRAFALFAHCFTCSKDVFAASRISQGLAERGFAVLRFDFTGLGAQRGRVRQQQLLLERRGPGRRGRLPARSARGAAAADRPLAGRRRRARRRRPRARGDSRRDDRRALRPAATSPTCSRPPRRDREPTARPRSCSAAAASRSKGSSSTTSPRTRSATTSPAQQGAARSSTRPATRSSASRTPPTSSPPRAIPRASSRSTTPTIC